jgi:hypothetical protein
MWQARLASLEKLQYLLVSSWPGKDPEISICAIQYGKHEPPWATENMDGAK